MDKYCKKCGTQIKEGDKFCGNCGAAIEAGEYPADHFFDDTANALAEGCLRFAKVLLWAVGGGMILACGCSAVGR